MFLPKKHADLPIEPSVLESLRAQEKSLKREKRKAAKERRQHAKQLKKAEKHAKKRIASRKVPQKASDCLQYLSMSQDGICEVEPGLFSMTMAFTDVNFQIAMLEEQKNIFTKYSEFLNYFDPSLHLEINLVTRSMDEEQFRRDTFLPLRGNDRDRYAEEMNQVVAEKALRGQNGLIREKYVTFSLHAENYQQAKEQLENRAADIADHFKRMGSSTRILSGIERLNLLQGIMRPNEEMSFSYDWLLAEDDLTTKDFISPSSYNWHPEHDDSRAVYRDRYQFGDKIGKTMYLRGIAPEMKNGLFSMLSELPFDHVITMHVDAMDQAEAVQEIEKKLAYMHKEEYDAIAKARERNMPASIAVSYDLKSKMHHTEQMMDDITTKNQKIFKVCILIHTYGDSNAQLDERVRRICSTVQQQTCRFDSILYEQRNAMNSMLPLGKKWLGLERTLETVSTAIYVPFTTQELFQPGGLYEGINARSKNLILCNRKLLPAPAGMVLGMTGYGKSFSVMQMVTNIMLRWPDDDIVLIDPEQEYTHLVTAMGGVVIDISASSPSHINPMDITEDYGDDEDPIRLKSQFLQNFCQLILHSSELSPQERTFIDVAAGLTYQRYMANPKREEMPTLHDFYRNLALQGEEVKPLLTALKLYVSGSMDLFAHQTNVNVQNHCICFNTVKLGKSMQSIGMLTVLDQVWNRITRNRVLGRRTWVFTDEFQQLLGNKDCTDFYFQLSSRARKWGAILTSITQHVRSVLDNEDARRMLSDCGYIKLLNLYKGEPNNWFYAPNERTATFTVETADGDEVMTKDYTVTFANATAIPWCPGELHDGQYGHYDLNCTIYLTGYDRYTDPETEAPNGADGGTGNLEALAESSNDGTLTRTVIKQDQYGNAYAGNAVTARFTKTVTLPPGAAGFKGWYENGADTYGNVEWASLLYRMDWGALYGVADGIKCRSVGSALTADELQALLAGLNIDPDTARGQVAAFAISCQGHFVYGQPSSLRGGPGNASVGMNLDCSSFVQYCYWAQGLPFSAGNTAAYGRTGDLRAISPAEVQPGDLRVVYAAGGEQGHVQMALGGGAWIECCYGYGVCVNMSNAWMESRGCHYFTYAGF